MSRSNTVLTVPFRERNTGHVRLKINIKRCGSQPETPNIFLLRLLRFAHSSTFPSKRPKLVTMILTQEMFHHNQTAGMPPAVQGISLDGQVIIITGGNTGLGYEAAKHFAIRGPGEIIMVCRDEKKGQDAVDRLKTETGFHAIALWTVDLLSFDSVKAIKDKIDKLDRLDILVENAGIGLYNYEVSNDGWEKILQVNVLSPALHMILHLPKLLETSKKHPQTVPRVVYVSSGAHFWETIPVEGIDASNTLRWINEDLLGQSFMRALQTRLPTVTCCSVNPGFCKTDLSRHTPAEVIESRREMTATYAYTAEEGSRQLLYAAIGERDKEERIRGGYLEYGRISECSDFMLGEVGQRLERKVWKEILEVAGDADEKARYIIDEYLSRG
ncbi:hypothetical protein V5O48_007313 [Marasmius crinis-equi]|uniref:Short-chain dehydrogenase n=1 Tax=Marasmius crinis-equi TaxID=585013 RepID=A0ABR3FHK9_9AGAR